MTRARLPDRRPSIGFDFEHGAHRYNATVSFFQAGQVAELFVHTEKRENDLTALMRDAAVLVSIALQFGAPLSTLRHGLTRLADGKQPASPIGAALDAAAAVAATTGERNMR